MKTVTVKISDSDYHDMVNHFQKDRIGKPLVGVIAVVSDITDPEACPGCGCMPGDGKTADCADPDGCGFEA